LANFQGFFAIFRLDGQAKSYRTYLDAESRRGVARRGTDEMSWEPVYRLIKHIPRGRVATYGELARSLRLRGGARAAGYAMAACPSGRGIPWHRVVAAGGRLIIREPYGSLQRKLLETEGVVINGNRVDMAHYAWRPVKRKKASARGRAKKR
jgi:methylated-DNA-protein-cysteine methyltransferase related protein